MEFRLPDALLLLQGTPDILRAMLGHLPDEWLDASDGAETWSPRQVVAHLIEAEQHNWPPRVQAILTGSGVFPPFDRFAHLQKIQDADITDLLQEFRVLRAANLRDLQGRHLTLQDLARTGAHPEFGEVTLAQLLATWTAHDLAHLVQVSRTLARNYRGAVGPWRAYLSVMNSS